MGTGQNGWTLDYGFTEGARSSEFIWPPAHFGDQMLASDGIGLGFYCSKEDDCFTKTNPKKEDDCFNKTNPKKKARVESKAEPGTKACREKMRRDRLNDRFTELCSILDPGKPPKTDKVEILTDATRLLNRLRNEEQNLKEANESLKSSIKNMKADKMELRDEKIMLKAEKERLEQIMKGLSVPFPFPQHSTGSSAGTSSADMNKTLPSFVGYPPVAMWQWMSPAAVDTSEDHMLRPPVA